MTFPDHFAAVARDYAAFRPGYPDALFDWLADVAPRREAAWDAGTGSGQAAVGLARRFSQVWATDASEAQLAHAVTHPRVTYRLAEAGASGLPDASVDLVTAAQAVHWFDRPRFWAEARRVLRPGGIVAVWCYGVMEITHEVEVIVRRFYRETVGPFWPPERRVVEDGYRTLDFPFAELTAPTPVMEGSLTLPQALGYIRSWSATQRYIARFGRDPVDDLGAELLPVWGDGGAAQRARWPLALRAGRV